MAFLNNLGKKIGSAAEATTSKAKEVAEVRKLNSKINDEEKQIARLYSEIGKRVFEQDKGNPQSPVADLCGQILSAQANIEQLKQMIEEAKNS
jgi:peptidoglycan hydrolase CwlO-like protein